MTLAPGCGGPTPARAISQLLNHFRLCCVRIPLALLAFSGRRRCDYTIRHARQVGIEPVPYRAVNSADLCIHREQPGRVPQYQRPRSGSGWFCRLPWIVVLLGLSVSSVSFVERTRFSLIRRCLLAVSGDRIISVCLLAGRRNCTMAVRGVGSGRSSSSDQFRTGADRPKAWISRTGKGGRRFSLLSEPLNPPLPANRLD